MNMPRLKLPLYVQLLGWFFLNLLLLMTGLSYFARGELGLSLNALLDGAAGRQIDGLVGKLAGELAAEERKNWDKVLLQVTTNREVQLVLVNASGAQLAGPPTVLPPKILEQLAELRRQRQADRRAERERSRPPPQDDLLLEGPPPGEGDDAPLLQEGRPPPPRRGTPPSPWQRRRGAPKVMVSAGEPARYWLLVGLPLRELGRREASPGVLLVISKSLSGGGLLFDPTPWWVLAGAVVFSAVFWVPFVVRITRSVGDMNRAARQISEGQFDVELRTRWGDVLDDLAVSINHLAVQLSRFVTGQKRFLGDVSHELCTPLARMEMALGILEQRADARQAEYVQDVREEVRVMSDLVHELLEFSKAGLAEKRREGVPVELGDLVRRVAAREAIRDAQVDWQLPENITVLGQPDLMVRAVGNVLRNAVRYAGSAGPITVSVNTTEAMITLWICDRGPGVPPEALAKLGEPFFRPELARTREGGGFGLGLAIVKTCMSACGGRMVLKLGSPTGLQVGLQFLPVPRG